MPGELEAKGYSHRALWFLQHRNNEARLPQRAGGRYGKFYAGYCRDSLQLLPSRVVLGAVTKPTKSPLSIKDWRTEGYLALIRNFQRRLWLRIT